MKDFEIFIHIKKKEFEVLMQAFESAKKTKRPAVEFQLTPNTGIKIIMEDQ